MAAHVSTVQNSRLKAMVIPREHGAWGMLLVPLLTGAVAALHSGGNGSSLGLFLVSVMSLFWLRTPLEAWLRTSAIKAQTEEERAFVFRVAVAIGALAAISSAALLWDGRNLGLLVIGAVAAIAFAVQAVVKRLGRKGRMPAQMIGAVGLTATAAGAYYVVTGKLDEVALSLWVANWLFAGDQIHFVQVRIHASRAATMEERIRQGRTFLLGQLALIAVILVAWRTGFFSGAIAIAFVPILLRGMLWFAQKQRPLDVHKLGFAELSHALAFAVILCAAFLL